jgi:hypothetical protein
VSLALVALLIPQAVLAESLLLFFKQDAIKNVSWHETIQQNAKQPATVSLNQNGDLMVKYGSMNVVLAYSPPEEPYKPQEPIRVAMAMSQDAPPISGISIRVNFAF